MATLGQAVAHRPYLQELVAEKRQIMRQTVTGHLIKCPVQVWKTVTHTTWGGEDKLKKERTVEDMLKTGIKVRAKNPAHRKQGVQGPRGIRGHVLGVVRNSV